MTLKIYEINETIEALVEAAFDPETGELRDGFAEADLTAANMAKQDILEQYALIVKNRKAEQEAIAKERKRLQAREKSLQNTIDFFREVLKNQVGGESLRTARVHVYTQERERLDIPSDSLAVLHKHNPDLVAKEIGFKVIDRNRLKADFKTGGALAYVMRGQGCELVKSRSVVVK